MILSTKKFLFSNQRKSTLINDDKFYIHPFFHSKSRKLRSQWISTVRKTLELTNKTKWISVKRLAETQFWSSRVFDSTSSFIFFKIEQYNKWRRKLKWLSSKESFNQNAKRFKITSIDFVTSWDLEIFPKFSKPFISTQVQFL